MLWTDSDEAEYERVFGKIPRRLRSVDDMIITSISVSTVNPRGVVGAFAVGSGKKLTPTETCAINSMIANSPVPILSPIVIGHAGIICKIDFEHKER